MADSRPLSQSDTSGEHRFYLRFLMLVGWAAGLAVAAASLWLSFILWGVAVVWMLALAVLDVRHEGHADG